MFHARCIVCSKRLAIGYICCSSNIEDVSLVFLLDGLKKSGSIRSSRHQAGVFMYLRECLLSSTLYDSSVIVKKTKC